jgi:hypothetical protein
VNVFSLLAIVGNHFPSKIVKETILFGIYRIGSFAAIMLSGSDVISSVTKSIINIIRQAFVMAMFLVKGTLVKDISKELPHNFNFVTIVSKILFEFVIGNHFCRNIID